MDLEFSPYRFELRGAANAASSQRWVEGLLLRRGGGHACLQTWPALGERSWQEEWRALQAHDWSSPVAQRLDACLRLDASARAAGLSLFEGLELPKSYYSVSGADGREELDRAQAQGFRCGKVKGGASSEALVDRLRELIERYPDWTWRVDMNGTFAVGDGLEFLKHLPDELRQKIDYVEDPFATGQPWPVLEGLVWAEDRCRDRGGEAKIRVLKPAIANWREVDGGRPLVLTTNFQHPLGMLFDWWEAAQARQLGRDLLPCGLVTQGIFEPNEWSEALGPLVPQPRPPSGLGLGLGEMLDRQEWRRA